ncbi:AI-2E family transporter [Mycolicibacterium llatzerense]|uniref:AI-2E family transporter n=1 Tax=Mycolicibacterium llatzerense TaxID=280871 RepID=UPI0021B569F6|nr:AI-2E family transporter [Mycolicibacterium llatzerense]MCT7362152.1 AI-2E family transporter [Mycolicibacterium llatzerense]
MSQADAAVDPVVRKAAAWSWRLLAIFGAVLAVLWVVIKLEVIVVPVLLATLAAAFLLPAVDLLTRRGLPRGAAVAAMLLSSIVVMGGILTFVVFQFIDGAPALVEQVAKSIDGARKWLTEGPILHLSSDQINSVGQTAIDALKNNQAKLTSGVFSTAGALTEIITGLLLVLFTLIFLLHGGRDIYAFVTRIFPASVRDRVRDAGRAGFGSLIGYVRATFVVALVDAVGIGTGLAIMGVPLALPLASLVFLGAFVPLVGAVLTGFVAVVVALIAKGWIYALIALGLIIAVQQLEAHVLQPIVMGRAVSVHPLAVVLAIAGGGVTAGIIGALIAVPIVAFLNSAIRVLIASDPEATEAELLAEAGAVAAATVSQGPTPSATDGPRGAADPQR